MNFSDFIWVVDNCLDTSTCQEIINAFENSPDKFDGKVRSVEGVVTDTETLKCTSVGITSNPSLQHIDKTISNSLSKYIVSYVQETNKMYGLDAINPTVQDTGYKVTKYNPGDGWFGWHHDMCAYDNGQIRVAGIIIYLNDVTEGGETEFKFGNIIKPKMGRVAIFPASWQYVHRGRIPTSNEKYIITSFITQQDTAKVYR